MKTFLFSFFAVLFLSSCQNEVQLKGTIQGIVINAQKVPLEGAKVTIFYLDESGNRDISLPTETTVDGKFTFPEINYCTFRLEVSKTGYTTQSKSLILFDKVMNNSIELK